jgi:hypothetical protein
VSRLRSLLHVASPSTRNTQQPRNSEVFSFLPPAEFDPDLARAIRQECGLDSATARQEARWQAERELAWRTFTRNATRILEAPKAQREALLSIYRSEATHRYGERMGTDMARSMESWLRAKGVH